MNNIFKGIFVFICVHLAESSTSPDSILDQSGEVSSKRSRFLSFNHEGGEVKVELDFAVPFLKIPVSTRRSGDLIQPSVEVNTKGIVTVGAMLFLFITVLPRVVQIFLPHAEVATADSFTPFLGRIDETLHSMEISSTECYQKASCWVASKDLVKYPVSSLASSQWIDNLIENDAVREAFHKGLNGEDCSIYQCPLSLAALSKLIKTG